MRTQKPENAATVLIDLSVRRRGVLTQGTWIEKKIRWAGRDLTTRIAGWEPKPNAEGAWLQEQIGCLPTIARLAMESTILLYTYSELEFEEWNGRPEMMEAFGGLFSRKLIKKCPAAVNRPRFRKNVDFQYYLKRENMIEFCCFLLELEPSVLPQATELWTTLPDFERDNLLQLGQFESVCRSLAKGHYPDAFHFWTAETNRLNYFLTMDRKFLRALSGDRSLHFRSQAVSPTEFLSALGISERDPSPCADSRPRTYYE